jgi:hypothetical protein
MPGIKEIVEEAQNANRKTADQGVKSPWKQTLHKKASSQDQHLGF